MKRVILFLLIVALAAFAYLPYYSTSKFRDAVNSGDKGALESMVKWDEVRGRMKLSIRGGLEKVASTRANPIEAARMVASPAFESALDGVMAKILNSATLPSIIKASGGGQSKETEFEERSWNGFTGFTARLKDVPMKLVFVLDGLSGWKLESAELDSSAVDTWVAHVSNMGLTVPGSGGVHATKENWNKDYKNPLEKLPPSYNRTPGR